MPVTAGATSTEANLNDTTPAAPAAALNVKWQAGSALPDPNDPNFEVRDISAYVPLDTDSTLASNSDSKVASQKATKTYVDTGLAGKVPTSRQINTTAPLTGGGDLSADRTLAINNFTGDSGSGGTKGAVPAPAAGDGAANKFLKADGTWGVVGTTINFADEETPSGTVNGSNTAFTLAHSPLSGSLKLFLNGQRLRAGSGNDYTLSGANITMAAAPATGDILLADYRY